MHNTQTQTNNFIIPIRNYNWAYVRYNMYITCEIKKKEADKMKLKKLLKRIELDDIIINGEVFL